MLKGPSCSHARDIPSSRAFESPHRESKCLVCYGCLFLLYSSPRPFGTPLRRLLIRAPPHFLHDLPRHPHKKLPPQRKCFPPPIALRVPTSRRKPSRSPHQSDSRVCPPKPSALKSLSPVRTTRPVDSAGSGLVLRNFGRAGVPLKHCDPILIVWETRPPRHAYSISLPAKFSPKELHLEVLNPCPTISFSY